MNAFLLCIPWYSHSKQAFLQDVPNPYELPDGTPSFKDYMGSRNNRYANPEAASKNHILYVLSINILVNLAKFERHSIVAFVHKLRIV